LPSLQSSQIKVYIFVTTQVVKFTVQACPGLRLIGAYAPEGERDLPGIHHFRWNISEVEIIEIAA
jgi:3-hydroxymyristoyl/3-hydroxydecanoyl-(acyl carrier protein) dehydratase